jgi:hypothetical protein
MRSADGVNGSYFVRVAHDPTGRRIMADGDLLGRLPGVATASAIVATRIPVTY